MDQVRRMLDHFDMGDTAIQELIMEIQDEPECERSGLNPHYVELLQELLSSTWFTSRRQDQIYESLAGSRPGDGLADLVFAFIFKRIMRRVMTELKEIINYEEVEIQPQFDLTKDPSGDYCMPQIQEIIWADDLAIAYRHSQC